MRWIFNRSHLLEQSEAIILEVIPTGEVRNTMTEARVLLQIMPKNGRNYVIESKDYFPAEKLRTFIAGSKTTVYVDSDKPSKIHWLTNNTVTNSASTFKV
jgi:hypothetical protein